jgi:hypothetical protein
MSHMPCLLWSNKDMKKQVSRWEKCNPLFCRIVLRWVCRLDLDIMLVFCKVWVSSLWNLVLE